MLKFLKEKFFFLIDKEEKQFIREKIMVRNHKVMEVFLGVLAVFELIVLISSLLGVENDPNASIELAYRIFYSFLIAICLICQICLHIFYKKNKPFPYYVFVTIFTVSVMLWGAGISLLASVKSFTFLYYVLTMVAASALICLEPWVETLCVLVTTVAYLCSYYCVSEIQRISDTLFISGIFITLIIVLTCFYFNFFSRVKAVSLELQITKLNATLEDKANTDKLTGVNNRLFLSERLENNTDADFTKGGVMMVDLDHFKDINDAYGHIAGDKCLSEIGRIIREFFANINSYCVRYGGEEFLIFVKEIDKDDLYSLAESLRQTVANNDIIVKDNIKINYTISIGLALGKNKKNFVSLIDESDKALYKAKKTRNSVKFLN